MPLDETDIREKTESVTLVSDQGESVKGDTLHGESPQGEVDFSDINVNSTSANGEDREPSESAGLKYVLGPVLHESDRAVVYRSTLPVSGKPIALKILKNNLTDSPDLLAQFKKGMEIASELTHPNLVPVYDCGVTEDGRPYVVRDLIAGETLAETLSSEGYLDAEVACELARQLCEALQQLHNAGLSAGCIKPENVFILKHGSGFVAKLADYSIGLESPSDATTGDATYASPELCMGYKTDSRSDIYSLGVLLYQALSGRPPFADDRNVSTIVKHLNFEAPRFSSFGVRVPRALEEIIYRCLEKNRSARYQFIADVLCDVEMAAAQLEFEDDRPLKGGRRKPDSRARNKRKKRRRFIRTIAVIAGIVALVGAGKAIKASFKKPRPDTTVTIGERVYDTKNLGWSRLTELGDEAFGERRLLLATGLWHDAVARAEQEHVRASKVAAVYARLGSAYVELASTSLTLQPALRLSRDSQDPLLDKSERERRGALKSELPVPDATGTRRVTPAEDFNGLSYLRLGEQYLEAALSRYKASRKMNHASAELFASLADAKAALGKDAESESLRREAINRGRSEVGFVAWQKANLGATLSLEGKLGEAESVLKEAMSGRITDTSEAQATYASLESVMEQRGHLREAEGFVRAHLSEAQEKYGPTSLVAINDELRLARVLQRLKSPEADSIELAASRHLRQRLQSRRNGF